MRILTLSSEVAPYAKTGGLADVAGSLPRALAARGHDVRVVMPLYAGVRERAGALRLVLPELLAPLPAGLVRGRVWEGRLDDSDVPVWFIDQPDFYDRPGLYGENGSDYGDNAERFAFFAMASLWAAKGLAWKPDIIQANDWQAGLAPLLLRAHPLLSRDPFFRDVRVLLTIHNLAYQGLTRPETLARVGLPRWVYDVEFVEYWGWVSFLKGGIATSDFISTVSPTYAREILTHEFGCGLEGFLARRGERLRGILNGVDYDSWDPARDPLIASRYDADDPSGKAACKEDLERLLGWTPRPRTLLLGMVNRLDPQKGVDLLPDLAPRLAGYDARLVFLGSGRADYQRMLLKLQERFPDRFRVRIGYDNAMAHRIEAGVDAFLMPSRYEPCGLNQMYSLRYGAAPIVRRVGGLADTVEAATARSVTEGRGTGFLFEAFTGDALSGAVREASAMFHLRPDLWARLRENGMRKDFSWNRSARLYEELFEEMLAKP